MKAFILAAGKGERMRPLTDNCPKPLLKVAGKTLLDHQIEKLVRAGVSDIVINIAYLGEKIEAHLGGGEQLGATLQYSKEPYPLETAGAICHAKALLGDDPFLLVNGDVWSDIDYAALLNRTRELKNGCGYLVFVPNPDHKQSGDFSLESGQVVFANQQETFTFSGVSVLSPALIYDYPKCREAFPLREVFEWGIEEKRLVGESFGGFWLDVGTPERLASLDMRLSRS